MGLAEVKLLLGIESNNTTNDTRLNHYLTISNNVHSQYNSSSSHYSHVVDLYACLLYLTFNNSSKDIVQLFNDAYQLELNQLYSDTS